VDPLPVGGRVDPDQVGDLLVAERLGVADQGERGREALQVPGEGADVGLVEVVDVEDEPAVGVHVGAEVLGVEIAVDPDPAGLLVQVRAAVGLPLQVRVEQARGAPVEGEGGSGHLPELHAEGRGVGGEELAEGGVEDGEDVLTALGCGGLRDRHRGCLLVRGAARMFTTIRTGVPCLSTRDLSPECPTAVSPET